MADLNQIRTFDWDDEIENEGTEFMNLVNGGTYFFEVTKFERGVFPGSAKIPPCNKAALTLTVKDENGRVAIVNDDIFLCDVTEWRISQFFISIGLKKHGEKTKMRWGEVVGCKGMFKVRHDKWTGKDGVERVSYRVDKYMDPADIPSVGDVSYEF